MVNNVLTSGAKPGNAAVFAQLYLRKMGMIRVLGRLTSINVRKVVWALEELGVPFERTDWGLPFRDPREPEFLALNPNATVPVLIDADGTTMWESNAILL